MRLLSKDLETINTLKEFQVSGSIALSACSSIAPQLTGKDRAMTQAYVVNNEVTAISSSFKSTVLGFSLFFKPVRS